MLPEAKRKEVVDFLHWALHDGQQFVAETNYAPLPKELVPRIEKRLDEVKTAK